MSDILDGLASALAVSSVGAATAGLLAAFRSAQRLKTVRFRRIEIRSDDGSVLYRDPAELSGTGDEGGQSPAEIIEVAEERPLTPANIVRISRASTVATTDSKRAWYKDPAILALLGVLFSSLLSAGTAIYVARSSNGTSPDCSAYVSALLDVHAANPNADVSQLFGAGGITFGDAEDACGPPEQFFMELE